MAATDSGSGGSSNNTSSVLSSIVSSYQDRSDSCSNPSLVQSMLRNTTETGDVGVFSIMPDSIVLPPSTHSRQSGRAKSRASTTSRRRRQPAFYGTREGIDSQASLRGMQAAEVHSMCRVGTPCSQHTRASSIRNESQVTLSDLPGPTQADLRVLQRPRSPYVYPARSHRPGYRSFSPALAYSNGTETRIEIGVEPVPLAHPPAALLRHTTGRENSRRPCITSGLGGSPAVHASPHRGKPLLPASDNPQTRKPRRALSVQCTPRHGSFMVDKTSSTDQQPPKTVYQRPCMTYYDYSENFDRQPSNAVLPQAVSRERRPAPQESDLSSGSKGTSQLSRANTTLSRAQTSMVVNTGDESVDLRTHSGSQTKGYLTEWEQLGLGSHSQHKKQAREKSPRAEKSPSSAEPITCDPEKIAAGFPVALLDAYDSAETVGNSNEINKKELGTNKAQLDERSSSTDETPASPKNDPKKDLSISITPLAQGAQEDESNVKVTEASRTFPKPPKIDTNVGFPQPEAVRIATLADLPIQSPKPERPVSYRNPNDRLSRILSIDESFSEAEGNATKPSGRRSQDKKICSSVGLQSKPADAPNDCKENGGIGTADESDPSSHSFQRPFQKLKDHFHKTHLLPTDDTIGKETKDTATTRIAGREKEFGRLEPPRTVENNPDEQDGRTETRTEECPKSIKNQRPKSKDDADNKPQAKAPLESAPDAVPRQLQNNSQETPPRNLGEHRWLPQKPCKHNPRETGPNDDSINSPPSMAASETSPDFLSSSSPTRSAPHQRSPYNSRFSESTPRIHLHPPTPSLGLNDISSIFSSSDFYTPPATSSGIVDAEVVGTAGSTTSRDHRWGSRRWTKVSSFFNSTRSTGGETGMTEGMGWWQYTGWKVREKVRGCGKGCLGKRRRKGRRESSLEMD